MNLRPTPLSVGDFSMFCIFEWSSVNIDRIVTSSDRKHRFDIRDGVPTLRIKGNFYRFPTSLTEEGNKYCFVGRAGSTVYFKEKGGELFSMEASDDAWVIEGLWRSGGKFWHLLLYDELKSENDCDYTLKRLDIKYRV